MGDGSPAPDSDARTSPLASSGEASLPAASDLTWQAFSGLNDEARIDLDRLPVVPGYELLEVLGRGGMGVVYKARQIALNRLVALKMIEGPGSRDPRYRRRFQAEAEAVARLHHPGIVQIHEIGSQNDTPYIALEYVEGGSLSRRRALFPLPPAEAARLVEQVARAVHHAHEHGIIHRDLKPANILLDVHGQPHLSDFGLAKQLDGNTDLTHTGQTLGTPQYMAPEQATGTRQIGPAADIYALGVILHELLTGQLPFSAPGPVGSLVQAVLKDPVPLTWLHPDLPADLEAICLRCLEKRPQDRYASAAALADDLTRYRKGEPIRARRNTVLERLRKWSRRQPALAASLAGTFLALLLGVVLASRFALDARQFATQAEQAREEAENRLYTSTVARAWLEWSGNANLRETLTLLHDARLESRRGWEWHFLQRLCAPDGLGLARHSGWVNAVAWSPDGRVLASAGGGNPYWHNQGPNAVIRPGETLLHDPNSGKVLRTLRGHTNVVRAVAFRPDGRWLATVGDDRTVRVQDVATGKELHCLDGFQHILSSVAFSPDGRRIALASWDGSIRVHDLDCDAEVFCRTDLGFPVAQLRISTDGHWLAGALGRDENGQVLLWDLRSGQLVLTLPNGEVGQPTSIAFRPDGTQLAIGTMQGVRIHELPDGRLRALLPQSDGVLGVSFSPDGQLLATAGLDQTVRLWQGSSGKEVRVCRGHTAAARCVAFHPDGQQLASGDMDGNVRLWDVALIPEHAPLRVPWHFGDVEALAFSEDGRNLISAERPGLVLTVDCVRGAVAAEQRAGLLDVWLTPAEPVSLDGAGQILGGITLEDPRSAGLWDVATGRRRLTLPAQPFPLWHVHLSANGQRVATVAQPRSRADPGGASVRVWDVQGRLLLERQDPGATIGRVALTSDGSLLAVAWHLRRDADTVDTRIQILDVARDRQTTEFLVAGDRVFALAFDTAGQRLAVAGMERRLLIHDLATGRTEEKQEGPMFAMDLVFSPDGKRLAIASRFQVKLHKADTGEEVLTLRSHQPAPGSAGFNPRVRFSPDGKRLAAVLNGHGEPISLWSLEAGSDEERAATASQRTVRWHLDQAIRCADQQNQAGLAFHLARLPEPLPDRWFSRLRGLELFARHGYWQQAVPDLVRSYTSAEPSTPRDWRSFIALLLWAGRIDMAREQARLMVEHFEGTGERLTARHLAMVALLASDALGLGERAIGLAHQQALLREDLEGQVFRALALVRAGQPAEALNGLELLERQSPGWRYQPLGLLVRILAQRALNQHPQAQATLQRVRSQLEPYWIPPTGQQPERHPVSWNWEWWLRFRILQREIEAP